MPTYILPQVLVFQDFQIVPAAAANPLRAHIAGPHAFLIRFADDDEREEGQLGFYDNLNDDPHLWPNRPAGAVVDQDFTKVWITDALLKYFEDTVGSGSAITTVAGETNQVRSDTVNFATNGAFSRDPLLLDRDVQIGDTAKVRCVPGGGDPVTLWTFVKDFIGDIIDDVIAAATGDADNAPTQILSAVAAQIEGPENCVTIVADGSLYDGLPSGDITETYTIVVLESSIGGDHTTASLRVLSASGNDDVALLVPSAPGTPTAIGTRGLEVTFSDEDTAACSLSADNEEPPVAFNDLIAGQKFEVTVAQAFDAPVPTSSGDYTGLQDTTYILEVTRGGSYGGAVDDEPQVSVSTTNGIDISGPTNVTGTGVDVVVGTEGVLVSFTESGLRKGDRYFVAVTAEAEGPLRTLVLGHNISDDVPDGTECDVTLFIRKDIQVEENRTHAPPLVNWETSETEITLKSGIQAFDSSWTDGGVEQALDVLSEDSQNYGLVFVEYRAWESTLCNMVNTIDDVALLNDISGPLVPENTLKWGVFKALSNSNGTEVKYTAVCEPDKVESWIDVLEILLGRDDVYGLVPLTKMRTVLDLYAAHVDAQSTPEEGLWRVAWFNLSGVPSITVVDADESTDGEVVKATVTDDPNTSGTQFTIVQVPDGNGQFISNDTRPGDIIRMLYTGDGFGNETFSEFVVDEVQNEDKIRLITGPAAAINVAAKIEIHRVLSATEEAEEVAKDAGSFNNRRVRAVWPDTIETSGTVQNGYHLAAALAGLTSGVVPHQGLTNLEIAGFTDVPRTTSKFNKPQLDILAAAGTWIVTQNRFDGEIFSRHAVTTGDTEVITEREEMVVRNVDSISFRFKDHFAPFIGVTNVTPSNIVQMGVEADGLIEVLKTELASTRLGGQLIDATVTELRQHTTLKDRVVMTVDADIPFPLNNLEIRLVI